MLMYFASGRRDYHRHPVPPHARPNWEFQAIVAGNARPTFTDTSPQTWEGRCLWIFPPGTAHGWASPANQPCQIAVFHFEPGDINEALRQACRRHGFLKTDLSAEDLDRIKNFCRDLPRHFPSCTALTPLLAEHICATISWVSLRNAVDLDKHRHHASHDLRVRQAMAWFSENMEKRIGVAEVAAAIGLTPGHLRKLCQSTGHSSPQRLMTEIRIDRAKYLLLYTDQSLADIAATIGMSGPTALCRRFVEHVGESPRAWAMSLPLAR